MIRKYLRFRLLTLFALTAFACMLLSAYLHFSTLREKVVTNHYLTYLNGKRAIELQRQKANVQWLRGFRSKTLAFDEWVAGLQMDRRTLENAIPLWNDAIKHAHLRNYYRRLQGDWRLAFRYAAPPELPPLPLADVNLSRWWKDNLTTFVTKNELNTPFMHSGWDAFRFDVEIVNNEPYEVTKDFFALRDIIGQ